MFVYHKALHHLLIQNDFLILPNASYIHLIENNQQHVRRVGNNPNSHLIYKNPTNIY